MRVGEPGRRGRWTGKQEGREGEGIGRVALVRGGWGGWGVWMR